MPYSKRGRKVVRVWTAEELQYLAKHYQNTPSQDIASHLGMTIDQVYAKAHFLDLHKSPEYIKEAKPGAATLREAGKAFRFQKGLVPWNTGTKGVSGLHDNCKATQFKKGRPAAQAHNYKPVGTLRVNADGFLERKMTDDPGLLPVRRWSPVHRLVWEEAHGVIPKTHKVVFKPGMKTTQLEEITLDRLELLTHAELMARNTIHNYPPELTEVMRVRGRLTRAINKRAKEQKA